MKDDGRLLDLYAGAPTEPIAPVAPSALPVTTPTTPAPATADWLGPLWETFPRAVRERYAPRAAIGEGGMGVVVEAEDRELRRVVAIKGVRDPKGISAEMRVRHVREARISARLTHPNIVPVFDTWTDARGNRWCSMLRVPGETPTLSRWLSARDPGEHPEQRVNFVTQVFLQICRAIHYAHGQGVLHRDLKPENVLIGPTGEALVADWGVASPISEAATGEIVGTPGYSAPEQLGQLGAARADQRSDVYALGVTLRELLAGKPNAPLPARTPRELAAVVARATAREPADRFADVPALSAAIEAYLAGELVEGLAYTPLERATRWVRAHALAVAVGLALVALATQQVVKSRETQAALNVSNGRLATADARNAVVALELDRQALARHHAAVSLQSRQAALPHREPPNEHTSALLFDLPQPDRLVWACTLEQPAEVARLHQNVLYAGSRFVSAWRFPLDGGKAQTVKMPRSLVWGLDISPAAKLVATPGGKAEVEVFELETGNSLGVGKYHTEPFWALAFSPDGTRLATGGFDKKICIWDPRDLRKPLRVLEGNASQLWAVAWSADMRQLAGYGTDPNDLRVFDLATGKHVVFDAKGYSQGVVFDPTGEYVTAGGDDGMRIFRIRDQALVLTVPHPRPLAIAFHTDGRIATSGQDNTARIWRLDLKAEKPTCTKLLDLRGHAHWISMISFTEDGSFLATASQDRTVRLWDVRERPPGPFDGAREPRAVAFTGDGRGLVTGDSDAVRHWGLDGRSSGASAVTSYNARALAFDRQGDGYAVLYLDQKQGGRERMALERYEKFARVEQRPLMDGGSQSVAEISADAKLVAVVAPEGPGKVWTLPDLKPVRDFRAAPVSWHGLAIDPTGSWIATGGTSAAIDLWSLKGAPDRKFPADPEGKRGHTEAVTGLAFSRDGRWLASGSQDFSLRVWDVAAGTSRKMRDHATDHVWCVQFDAEAKLVAGGGPSGLLYLHDIESATVVEKFQTPHDGVNRLALSPDGRWLAVGGSGRPALYDLAAWRHPKERISEVLAESLFEEDDGQLRPRPASRQRPICLR